MIKVHQSIINDIIKNNGKLNIKINIPNNDFESIFSYKNKSKNYFFYQCKNRPKCKGLDNFSIKENKFIKANRY